MDDNIAIKLENVSKEYRIYKSNRQKVAHELLGMNKGVPFKALNGINLEIRKGENVGILGSVGSGRSTLAKILSGITFPTEGKVDINGSVIPVFDIKSGFDLNFDGYENIRIKGCMMGWDKKQIKEKQQEIIEFAQLQDLVRLKMKAMKPVDRTMLGLSMVLMDDSEIMVFDSPIKVGSFAQRGRVIEKLKERAEDGNRTFVMVNVIWEITGQLCERGIVLHNGEVKFDGPFNEAVDLYKEKYRDKGTVMNKPESNDRESDDEFEGASDMGGI